MHISNRLAVIFLILLGIASYPVIAIEPGKVTGGVSFVTPDWFKDSFLEIASDVEEANEVGKHVLLFFPPQCMPLLQYHGESAVPERTTEIIHAGAL